MLVVYRLICVLLALLLLGVVFRSRRLGDQVCGALLLVVLLLRILLIK